MPKNISEEKLRLIDYMNELVNHVNNSTAAAPYKRYVQLLKHYINGKLIYEHFEYAGLTFYRDWNRLKECKTQQDFNDSVKSIYNSHYDRLQKIGLSPKKPHADVKDINTICNYMFSLPSICNLIMSKDVIKLILACTHNKKLTKSVRTIQRMLASDPTIVSQIFTKDAILKVLRDNDIDVHFKSGDDKKIKKPKKQNAITVIVDSDKSISNTYTNCNIVIKMSNGITFEIDNKFDNIGSTHTNNLTLKNINNLVDNDICSIESIIVNAMNRRTIIPTNKFNSVIDMVESCIVKSKNWCNEFCIFIIKNEKDNMLLDLLSFANTLNADHIRKLKEFLNDNF